MRRWVVEAIDSAAVLIGRNDEVYARTQDAAESQGWDLWPEARKVYAYLWYDNRDDWEILSPGE